MDVSPYLVLLSSSSETCNAISPNERLPEANNCAAAAKLLASSLETVPLYKLVQDEVLIKM